jgi:hypothetical protein
MNVPILLTTIALVVLSLAGGSDTATSTTPRLVAPMPFELTGVPGQNASKFSSAYTPLTKCGSGMTKKEEKAAEQQGSDIPTRCKGYDGYDIYIYYSACSSHITADKGGEGIPLATQTVDWKQKTVEWRMANGKPFAVIMRAYEYGGTDDCATGGKITGEVLIVKGLKGYERIDETVKVKGTPNANIKAREIADKGYAP